MSSSLTNASNPGQPAAAHSIRSLDHALKPASSDHGINKSLDQTAHCNLHDATKSKAIKATKVIGPVSARIVLVAALVQVVVHVAATAMQPAATAQPAATQPAATSLPAASTKSRCEPSSTAASDLQPGSSCIDLLPDSFSDVLADYSLLSASSSAADHYRQTVSLENLKLLGQPAPPSASIVSAMAGPGEQQSKNGQLQAKSQASDNGKTQVDLSLSEGQQALKKGKPQDGLFLSDTKSEGYLQQQGQPGSAATGQQASGSSPGMSSEASSIGRATGGQLEGGKPSTASMVSVQSMADGAQCHLQVKLPTEWAGKTWTECTVVRETQWCATQAGIWKLCPSFKAIPSGESPIPMAEKKSPNVIINEVMWTDQQPLHDEDNQPSDWLELQNLENAPINLEGWWLSDSPTQGYMWRMPAVELGPGSFLLVFASGKDRTGKHLHTNFKLKSHGEFLSLMRPDKTYASVIEPHPASQLPGYSYGTFNLAVLGGDPTQARLAYALLETPTPAAGNGAPLTTAGPSIVRSTHSATHGPIQPGEVVEVQAVVRGVLAPISKVYLVHRINFREAIMESMQATDEETPDGAVFKGQVPAKDHKAGDMVRWYIQSEDALGSTSRLPPGPTDPTKPQWFGTMVNVKTTAEIPTLFWWTDKQEMSLQEKGGRGSIFYNDTLYDNVLIRRRGVTALSWAKPKLKVKFHSEVFKWREGASKVDEFSLQSFFFELGEKSYMKEVIGLQVMKEAGVIAPESFHLQVAQNGKFFGLFAFVEDIGNEFLQRHALSTGGSLFKAVHGEMSNLRWDIPVEELKFYYAKGNRKGVESDWLLLAQLSKGLAGGGPGSRSTFMFDNLNMPQIINEMATQTLLNNMDRCTKNFYLYRDDKSGQWYRFPWDMDGSLGQSNGLGGKSATDYCVLACEQWNSPLYCDSEHPQDAVKSTPWGSVTVTLVADNMRPANVNRKLQAETVGQASSAPQDYRPRDWANPDRSTIGQTSTNGVAGTYNHLVDAILDVGSTREMYMRRLRSLTDMFLVGGRLAQIVNDTYTKIMPVARRDHTKWNIGDIDRGYQQIITEFIPIRKDQLLEMYGPAGSVMSLLPEAQAKDPVLELYADIPGSDLQSQHVEVRNKGPYAVDLSSWKLSSAEGATVWIPAGTVIPTGRSVYITPSVAMFKANSPHKGKSGLLIVGGLNPPLKVQAGIQLVSTSGAKVAAL